MPHRGLGHLWESKNEHAMLDLQSMTAPGPVKYLTDMGNAPIPLGYDLFPTMPTIADLETYARAATIGKDVNRGQRVFTAGMIGMIFCTRSRYAVFPIPRINLR